MGQLPFDPPNVRGWIGGRAWINSATLAVRRQVIEAMLRPINEEALNADEVAALSAERAQGTKNFTLDENLVNSWSELSAAEATAKLFARVLPGRTDEAVKAQVTEFLAQGSARPRAAVRLALGALLESPYC
jgi:hypothetical protein